jgi:hypothetical protein
VAPRRSNITLESKKGDADVIAIRLSMIPKSGIRISEEIMLKQKVRL